MFVRGSGDFTQPCEAMLQDFVTGSLCMAGVSVPDSLPGRFAETIIAISHRLRAEHIFARSLFLSRQMMDIKSSTVII